MGLGPAKLVAAADGVTTGYLVTEESRARQCGGEYEEILLGPGVNRLQINKMENYFLSVIFFPCLCHVINLLTPPQGGGGGGGGVAGEWGGQPGQAPHRGQPRLIPPSYLLLIDSFGMTIYLIFSKSMRLSSSTSSIYYYSDSYLTTRQNPNNTRTQRNDPPIMMVRVNGETSHIGVVILFS